MGVARSEVAWNGYVTVGSGVVQVASAPVCVEVDRVFAGSLDARVVEARRVVWDFRVIDWVEVLGADVDYQLVNELDLFEVGEFVDCNC